MVIKIPRGYIFPHSHHKSAPCPLCFVFLFHCISQSLSSRPSSPCACHTQLCLFLCLLVSLSLSLSSDFSLSLNVFFCSNLSRFSFSLLSPLPVVLTSCPVIEGGRSRGGRGMLILQRCAERELARGRETEMSLV